MGLREFLVLTYSVALVGPTVVNPVESAKSPITVLYYDGQRFQDLARGIDEFR